LIALLLFFMGTNIFKWFGAMMLTTMLLTLFVNVPITKILLHMFYKNQQDKAH
jgi:preprotein translocase subunit SecD